jgi:hypothetical protein
MTSVLNELVGNISFEFLLHQREGHVHSLNSLWDCLNLRDDDYIFHLEDDWEFIKDGHFIRECFDVMSKDTNIKSVLIRQWAGEQYMKFEEKIIPKAGHYFFIHFFNEKTYSARDINTFPTYTLNPTLQKYSDIKSVGLFNNGLPHNTGMGNDFEYNYALKCHKAGFKLAILKDTYVKHIGNGNRAYDL